MQLTNCLEYWNGNVLSNESFQLPKSSNYKGSIIEVRLGCISTVTKSMTMNRNNRFTGFDVWSAKNSRGPNYLPAGKHGRARVLLKTNFFRVSHGHPNKRHFNARPAQVVQCQCARRMKPACFDLLRPFYSGINLFEISSFAYLFRPCHFCH